MCSGSNQAPSESTAVRFTGAPRGGRDASVGQGRHIGRQMVVVEGESGTVVTGERSGDRFDLPAGDHVHRPGVILDLQQRQRAVRQGGDRKSTRLNSSHVAISYAVFCLKKKNNTPITNI